MTTQLTAGPRAPGAARGAAVAILALAVGGAAGYGLSRRGGPDPEPPAPTAAPAADEGEAVVRFPREKWESSGVRVEPAASAPFTESVWRSGRLALDESRVAHVAPMVEGVVREVKARLGRDVAAGEVLAVLDAREVGQAKLELVRARLAAGYADAQHAWAATAGKNAAALVEAVAAGASVADIDARFRDRPIGGLRQQLMTAYSHHLQAKAQYAAVSEVQGATSRANLLKLRAEAEAADAAVRALCEEVRFQTAQDLRAAEQKLREARTGEALARAQLLMIGYTKAEVDAMDPIAEGAAVSHYPVRAPLAGTVLEQHAVVAERVGPQHQMFQLADLGTLWLRADVPPQDLPLAGGTVRFRSAGRLYDAAVFYPGDLVDPDTRAVTLTASVANPGRALKAGAFVDVELSRTSGPAVQVPAAAVQRDGGKAFVFAYDGKDGFRRADVTLGRESGGTVEVTAGLAAGQAVAVAGGFALKSELFRDRIAGE